MERYVALKERILVYVVLGVDEFMIIRAIRYVVGEQEVPYPI